MGLRSLLVLHRRMGLVSALFVVLLAITGLLLHHSNTLGLDRAGVGSTLLLDWYGIEQPEITVVYEAAGATVAQIERSLFFNSRQLSGEFVMLQGMAPAEFGFVVATASALLLLTREGDTIEVLGAEHGVPVPIVSIAEEEGELLLRSESGVYSADLDALRFSVSGSASPNWSEPSAPSAELAATLPRQYAASLVSWERVILDLHSGQLFGSFGRLLVDIMALLFILMGVTGVWIWSRRRP